MSGSSVKCAGVFLLDNPYIIDKQYDYSIPSELEDSVFAGSFVTVPFGNGNRKNLGVVRTVCELPSQNAKKLKSVFSVCPPDTSISEEMMKVCEFMCSTTLCTMGDAIRAVIPTSSLLRSVEFFSIVNESDTYKPSWLDTTGLMLFELIRTRGSVTYETLKARFGPECRDIIDKLIKKGLIVRGIDIRNSTQKPVMYCRLAVTREIAEQLVASEGHIKLTEKQRSVLACLLKTGSAMPEKELCEKSKAGPTVIQRLCSQSMIVRYPKMETRDMTSEGFAPPITPRDSIDLSLNDEQAAAFDRLSVLLDDKAPRASLLYGVTGSGKTRVMMRIIEKALDDKKGVILLLPEISLTPQTLGLFCSYFGKRVAVIHSGLTKNERLDAYMKIKSGQADLVIGTRSAIFAPVRSLGLIVIDEEQEHTYKSDMSPRYHARDIARFRCATSGSLMLLASATPSVESYYKAISGKYELIKLTKRAGGSPLPKVTVVDMRRNAQGSNISPFSIELRGKLREVKDRGEQSILFLNRRGYSNFLSCRTCGTAVLCPHCSVAMKYHIRNGDSSNGFLVCHLCGTRFDPPTVCPSCGSEHMSQMGFGTQKIEKELSYFMEDATVLRLDADSTSDRDSLYGILDDFREKKADILLGTQMVTKGHDFENVTLVGVMLADMTLYLDDYRASERTFAMLTQVIGRAGRAGTPGEALIQTNNPDNEIIRLAATQDYDTFFNEEIRTRKLLTFPPFCDIALLNITSMDEKEIRLTVNRVSNILRGYTSPKGEFSDVKVIVFGPFEAPVYKVEDRYRMRILVKCVLNRRTREMFSRTLIEFAKEANKNTVLAIDFNPTDL